MQGLHELISERDMQEAARNLQRVGLSLPVGVTLGLGLYEDSRMIATGFLAGNVLCGISVDPEKRGEGLAAFMVSRLVERGAAEGRNHFLLFTKPGEAGTFKGIGFSAIACTDAAALLELGRPGYEDWVALCCRELAAGKEDGKGRETIVHPDSREKSAVGRNTGHRAAVVMNANPFSLGHRYLVEAALGLADTAVVFVVQEEASAFPFSTRLALVREGLADLDRVTVLPGGSYMVSLATFPAYFTGEKTHAAAHASLDATLFASRVAPDLGLDLRLIGTEPLCPVTAVYNETLQRILPARGIACVEVPRLSVDNRAVSASFVRELLRHRPRPWETIARYVPPTTLRFLRSEAAQAMLERLGAQG